MEISEAIFLGQQSLWTVAMISGPILIAAMTVGVLVSLFQAVTQLQEMTIVFVPKIITVFILVAIMGGWMLTELVEFGTFCFSSVENVTQ
jgi:flagellar biosynthetic protein FliQ